VRRSLALGEESTNFLSVAFDALNMGTLSHPGFCLRRKV
jgi:hypothetical protein